MQHLASGTIEELADAARLAFDNQAPAGRSLDADGVVAAQSAGGQTAENAEGSVMIEVSEAEDMVVMLFFVEYFESTDDLGDDVF